jgi:hypothetical protein
VRKTHIDPSRPVTIAKEDLVFDEKARTASLPLSILSLSCPEIFSRPVSFEEDRPVTFSLDYKAPPPAILLGNTPRQPSPPSYKESTKTLHRAPGVLPISSSLKVEQEAIESNQPLAIKPGEQSQTPDYLLVALKKIAFIFPPDLETPAIHDLTNSDAILKIPFALLKPQLASGKIAISTEKFRELVPADLKERFDSVDSTADIPIPLEEVIPQLSPDAFRRRDDQEIVQEAESILTPFSEQVREDAIRLGRSEKPEESSTPVPPAANAPLLQTGEVLSAAPVAQESPKLVNIERLQSIFMTDESLDLGEVIAHIAKLPGLTASLLTYRDGRKIAGDLRGLKQEPALAPLLAELFNQADAQISPLNLGALETLTLHCGGQQLSAFLHRGYSLIVLHENRPFKPGVREKIRTVLNEIA